MVDACGIEAIFAEIGTPTTDLGQMEDVVLDVCTRAMCGHVLTSLGGGGGEKAREQYRQEEGCYKYLCNKDHCLVLWFSSGEATRELAGRLGFLLGEASLPTYPVVSGLLSSDDNRVAATLLCHLPDFGDFNSICAFLHAMWRMRVTR